MHRGLIDCWYRKGAAVFSAALVGGYLFFVVYWDGEKDGYIKIIHLCIGTVLLSKSVQAFCLLSQNKYKWFDYLPNILTLAYGYIL